MGLMRGLWLALCSRAGKPSQWIGHHNGAMLVLPVASDATAALLEAKDILT